MRMSNAGKLFVYAKHCSGQKTFVICLKIRYGDFKVKCSLPISSLVVLKGVGLWHSVLHNCSATGMQLNLHFNLFYFSTEPDASG